MSKRLLCLSYRFPPEPYPVATRVKSILAHLDDWRVDALTAAPEPWSAAHVTPHRVPSPTPDAILSALRRAHLEKLIDWLVWPDASIFWMIPAYRKARALMEERDYDAIVVFVMPYASALAGVALAKTTGCPLVINLDDSPTCSDLHPTFPSPLHARLARAMEDLFARTADALVYVSRRNMERVRDRQPPEHQDDFHLVRWGSRRLPSSTTVDTPDDRFRIVYTGGTSGWYAFRDADRDPSALTRAFRAWQQAGEVEQVDLDYRTHGPIYAGRAVNRVLERHPEWDGRIRIDLYGKRYPTSVTDAVLDANDLHDVVTLHGQVPHDEALRQMVRSDLLFMALPDRPDGSPGGRISAKTYEYLMTDRPILAALPPGENRSYLQEQPGVHLTDPDGVEAMADVIERLAEQSLNGGSIRVDREAIQPALTNRARAQTFERVLEASA